MGNNGNSRTGYVDPYKEVCLNCPIEEGCVADLGEPGSMRCPRNQMIHGRKGQTIPPGFVNLPTAARMVGIPKNTFRRRIADGAVPALRSGNSDRSPFIIPLDWIEQQR